MSSMIGAKSAARDLAASDLARRALAQSAAVPARPRNPPSRLPRTFAAARAARVRSEIIFASCSAMAAIMWIVRRFACGKSTAWRLEGDTPSGLLPALADRSAFRSQPRCTLRPASNSHRLGVRRRPAAGPLGQVQTCLAGLSRRGSRRQSGRNASFSWTRTRVLRLSLRAPQQRTDNVSAI